WYRPPCWRWVAFRPVRPELVMTLPRCAADVLADHVRLEIECIDRMYLNVFVPELQRTGQVIGFLMRHRGFPIASTALVAPITRQFLSDICDFAAAHDVRVIRFAKGQRKDAVRAAHRAGFPGREGIVFMGVAQEKAPIFRTERRHNPVTGAASPWIVTATGIVNHYYFYGVDEDFGPFFLKFCSYFPVRHVAPCDRVEVRCLHRDAVAAA